MNRPTPIAELVVRRFGPRSFQIFTTSRDAAEWARREMSAYGILEEGLVSSELLVVVAPAFDVAEVMRYAESYNTVEKE